MKRIGEECDNGRIYRTGLHGLFLTNSLRRHYPDQVIWVFSQPAVEAFSKSPRQAPPLYSKGKGT